MITRSTLGAFVGMTAATLAVVVGMTSQSAVSAPQHHSGKSLPACRNEDGSGQRGACWWNGGQNGKGARYVISNGQFTHVITAPHACRALANVGSWKSKGSDGTALYNGRTLASEMISDANTFGWSTRTLTRACAGWLGEYAKDTLK
jgi:hypothetical protein